MDDTRLRHELREAALAHRPDHTRILARVERGLATPAPAARPPRPATRWAGRRWAAAAAVTAAVAGAVGLAGVMTTAPTDRATAPAASATAPALPAPGPAAGAVGTINPGSNRWWAQSDLGVTTGSPVTGLVVELRIARTAGVVSTGHWRTRPVGDFTVTVTEEPGSLVYRWTLKEGRTLPPGPHVFAAQYNHAEGVRDASSDTYRVTLTAPDGGLTTLRGGFGTPPPK